ncbi:endonuclease/exonuclease/phosphatase family protein, putative [Babesia bigemina]|uniref:Endonuclease/exonuclease/phosphatase family protein, putative n=1 Tax=Babesia bigemina TaxID=5866 RepID=A0A061DAU3_BABBI|nr:endonuclease/exonuclease/phosphatase family protein, putative [Babesia bigemina]CDR97678.1 endonuclease/exonuclease/phosphatase family protein, putative [Babesia bigemina]|eukprot:XP_012769864.1 endonuclease/exonuclease/phosphatase family protein, putative [Babesia bigemina]
MAQLVPVTLMSYNVQGIPSFLLPIADLDSRISAIAQYVSHVVRRYNVDVLVCQEMFSYTLYNEVKKALKDYMGLDSGILPNPFTKSGWKGFWDRVLRTVNIIGSGVIIFSKHPILNREKLLYSDGVYTDVYAAKGAVATRISVNNRLIDVVGTHLQTFREKMAHTVRVAQMAELREWMGTLFGRKGRLNPRRNGEEGVPIVLLGDLNCCIKNQHDKFWEVFSAFRGELETAFGFEGIQPTFSTRINDFCRYQQRPDEYDDVYDYIFKPPQVEVLQPQTVVRDSLKEPIYVGGSSISSCLSKPQPIHHASDHQPIFAILKI